MDLDRTPGTIYGLETIRAGYIRRVRYMDAYLAWKDGYTVYTKDGTGTRSEVSGRPWTEHKPLTGSEPSSA